MGNQIQKNTYANLLTVYIVIQPIIDIFTSYFLLQLNISITPGLIIRNVALIMAIGYVFAMEKKHWNYLFLIGIYYVIHVAVNYYYKEVFHYYQEISYFSKYVFFIAVLITIEHLLRSFEFYSLKEKVIKALWQAMGIISICILLAALTRTGIESYGSAKIGQTGWFFSGTKISAAMAILFPVSLFYTIKNYSNNKILYLLLMIANISAMFMTGTKSSYMGIVLGLFAALILLGIRVIAYKEHQYKKIAFILLALVIGVVIYTPYSPVYKNIGIHQSWNAGVKPDILFNGREIKLGSAQEDYVEANLVRKWTGVGYGGDYESVNHIVPIERDFHEMFFYYGIVGFILLLAYPLGVLFRIIKYYLAKIHQFPLEDTMLITSLGAGLGCSFIAGHVLFAPSVSIFLACVMAMLCTSKGKNL